MWIINALLSAFFRDHFNSLSKLGLEDISSHYLTALRTSIVWFYMDDGYYNRQ